MIAQQKVRKVGSVETRRWCEGGERSTTTSSARQRHSFFLARLDLDGDRSACPCVSRKYMHNPQHTHNQQHTRDTHGLYTCSGSPHSRIRLETQCKFAANDNTRHAPLAHKSYDGRWTPDRSQSRSLAIISRISRSPSRRLEHTLCDPHGAALTPTRRTALSPASTLALSRAHSTHPMQSRWLPFITPGRSLRHAGQ